MSRIVSKPPTKQYRDNWDAIFGKPKATVVKPEKKSAKKEPKRG